MIHPRNLKIRAKLVGLLVGVCAVVLAVVCTSFVVYDRISYSAAKAQTMTVLADAIAGSAAGPVAFRDPESAGYVLNTLGAEPTALYAGIYLHTPEEAAAHNTLLSRWGAETQTVPPTFTTEQQGYMDGQLYVVRPIQSQGTPVGTLVMVLSTTDIDARSRELALIALVVLVGSIGGAFLVASLVQRVITQPIYALADGARRVREEQDYAVRVTPSSGDELGELADAFNTMLEGIQRRDHELLAHQEQLEARVRERTRDLDQRNAAMRMVLDNVDQGLVTVSRRGTISSERSAAFERWFGASAPGDTLADAIARHDAEQGDWFALSWESITDDFLPVDVALAQMPRSLSLHGAEYTLRYKSIERDGELDSVLIVITDITDEVARRRIEEEQREFVSVVERMMHDRGGFEEFAADAEQLVDAISVATAPSELLKRQIHTLKGNSSLFGLQGIGRRCHTLEDAIQAEDTVDIALRDALVKDWRAFSARIRALTGEARSARLEVTPEELEHLLSAARTRLPHAYIAAELLRLQGERLDQRLERIATSARGLASRLGHADLHVQIENAERRIPVEPLAPFWSSLGHVIRNALDHGLESSEDRAVLGKPPVGTLTLRVLSAEDHPPCSVTLGAPPPNAWCLEIGDDGRGIRWDAVADAARRRGLPADAPEALLEALFADGVTTRSAVSELSGRGVGMAAVRAAVEAAGGTISVHTLPGQGTRWRFWFPSFWETPHHNSEQTEAAA